MKRALIVLGVIAGLIIAVAIVGWLLPKEHTATAERAFDSPAAEAWVFITHVEGYPDWRPYVESVEVTSAPGEPLIWEEDWESGDAIAFQVVEKVEGQRLVATIVSEDLPFGGSWTYEITPTGGGCTVTITENGEIYDPFFRFFSHLFMDQAETMKAYLSHLDTALSGGEDSGASGSRVDESGGGLDRLVSWMTGSFTSASQAAADSDYYDIRLEMVPIWSKRDDGFWLYVEQASARNLERPYRQRVYRVTADGDRGYKSDVFTFESPLRFAGAWKDPERFASLTPDSLSIRQGCAVFLAWGAGAFDGATRDSGCESALRGASHATSEVSIKASAITSWDRGFDADGAQVWGAEKGPYVFTRTP